MGKLSTVCIAILFAVTAATHKHDDIVTNINKAQRLWTAEHNEVTKRGTEYNRKLLGTIIPENLKNIERKKAVVNDVIPDQFDSRSQWPDCVSIASIRDQGECGSCWAIAAAGAASDRLCVSTNTQMALNLSAENLMSCCFFCSLIGGCNGGFPDHAWAYIKFFGLVTGGGYDSQEGCQPYQIPPSAPQNSTTPAQNSSAEQPQQFLSTPFCQWTCTNDQYYKTYLKDKHRSNSFYTLENSVSAIQSEIMTYGPVQASFRVYEDFMHYKSGVYVQSSSNYLGGHSARIVGWGSDPVSQVDFWVVANSWNTTWGDNGWFKIRRGTDECGIEDYVTAGRFDS